MAYKIDLDTCVGCGTCVDECPVGCISLKDNKCEIDKDQCLECGACAGVCPVDAPAEE